MRIQRKANSATIFKHYFIVPQKVEDEKTYYLAIKFLGVFLEKSAHIYIHTKASKSVQYLYKNLSNLDFHIQ